MLRHEWVKIKNGRTSDNNVLPFIWSRVRDPNPPPAAWEAAALPDELTLHCSFIVAKQGGLVKSETGQFFSAKVTSTTGVKGSNTSPVMPSAISRRFCWASSGTTVQPSSSWRSHWASSAQRELPVWAALSESSWS